MVIGLAPSWASAEDSGSAGLREGLRDFGALAAPAPAGPAGSRFEALGPEATGIRHINRVDRDHPLSRIYMNGFACGGVAIGDVDGDGRPDLYLTGGATPNTLYRQTDAFRFEDITERAGVAASDRWSAGASFADVDNDGDLDLHVCCYDAPNLLFLNDGTGVFTEAAEAAGVAVIDASLMASFADYDRDGDLDFYLLTQRLYRAGGLPTGQTTLRVAGERILLPEFERYYRIERQGANAYVIRTTGRPDRLFENDGTGRFRDVTDEAGIAGRGYGQSATWIDFDGDGWLDLHVANDFKDPDRLYRNALGDRAGGTDDDASGPVFTDVIRSAVPHTPWFSMGADTADLDNDGRADLVVLDMSATTHYKEKVSMGDMDAHRDFMDTAEPRQLMRNAVFINSGTRRFFETAFFSGLARSDWSWAAKLADFDNDGWVDVFVTNGVCVDFTNADRTVSQELLVGREEWSFYKDHEIRREANLAFRNLGDLRFASVGSDWGLDHVGASYAAAWGDFDGDGNLDLVVASLDEPVALFRNRSDGAAHRVAVVLRGKASNRSGIGAVVRLTAGGMTQTRMLNPMTGFQSSNEPIVHFGMGEAAAIDRLEVEWPSGHRQIFEDLAAGRRYVVVEPGGAAPPITREAAMRGEAGVEPLFAVRAGFTAARHTETAFDDFALQPLLPNKLSHLGPGVAVADIDGDGDDDFHVGAARGETSRIHWNDGGKVSWEWFAAGRGDLASEDMAALFFDADRDGDPDLLVTSGGVEDVRDAESYGDRLYLNQGGDDGKGRPVFVKAAPDVFPSATWSSGPAAAADFDRDGDLDVFIGGRVVPGRYPTAPPSRLLRNDSTAPGEVAFTDATAALAPPLAEAGMVTGAIWSDADGDGWIDLLCTTEWGPIRLFRNREGRLVEETEAAGLAAATGWWHGLAARDLDGDGDIDYVATNFGLNTKYHPDASHPNRIYFGTFGEETEPHIIEAKVKGDELLPVRGKSCSQNAMPFLREKFPTYDSFARASLLDIYSRVALGSARRFEVTWLASSILRNDGTGRFTLEELPARAQLAPAFGVVATEVDGDGIPDLYLVQNFHHPQRETGIMAGGLSALLLGTASGEYREVGVPESGLFVPDDARGVAVADLDGDGGLDFVIGVNDGHARVLGATGTKDPVFTVRLRGRPGNPGAIGARVTVRPAQAPPQTAEVAAGGSYLSQSSPTLRFGLGVPDGVPGEIEVRWPDGRTTLHHPAGRVAGEVVIQAPDP